MSGPDLAEQVLPWFQVQAQEWHAGRFPLWDPYLWAGQPLFGQAQPGAAYPLNWILFLLPLENGHIAGWALAWYYVAIHLMAAGFLLSLLPQPRTFPRRLAWSAASSSASPASSATLPGP